MNNLKCGGFSTRQAADLADLGYDTVDYWDHSAFLKPSVSPAQGRGRAKGYSFADVLALRAASKLRKQGIALQALRKVLAYLRKRKTPQPELAHTYLVSDGKDVFEHTADELYSVLRKPGAGIFFFVLDLTATEKELRRDIKDLITA